MEDENSIVYPPTPPSYETDEDMNLLEQPSSPPRPLTPPVNDNSERDRVIHPNDLFWFVMKVKIERVIEHLLGTVVEMKIVSKSRKKPTQSKSDLSYMLRIIDDSKALLAPNLLDPYEKNITLKEQVNRLFDRSDLLQEKYKILLERVSNKMDSLREIYNEEEYDISVDKLFPGEELDYLSSCDEDEDEDEENLLPVSDDNESIDSVSEYGNENALDSSEDEELSYLYPETNMEEITVEYPRELDELSGLLVIGPNGTTIRQEFYEGLLMKSPTAATRLLCDLVFGDDMLATHSLTGNQSPAFQGRQKPVKKQLDPLKTEDITQLICSKFNVNQQLVRSTITTKCADAAKKVKRILSKVM